jgi:thiamine biosynthesis protein ThiI
MDKGLLLLSGGIDSPVAGKLAVDGGAEILAVHFSTVKITGRESVEKTKKLCRILGVKTLFLCDASEEFAEIAKGESRLYFVLTKRFMLKTAEKIALQNNVSFLLTGENLGQVSSQTLSNMAAIDFAVKMPVVRPLISFEKGQIVEIARKIGTLEISEGKEICDALGPKHPFTKTYDKTLTEQEKACRMDKLVEQGLKKIQVYQP